MTQQPRARRGRDGRVEGGHHTMVVEEGGGRREEEEEDEEGEEQVELGGRRICSMLQAARHRRILAWAGILAGSGEDGRRRVKRREGNTVT
jgi:hypothetical protein